MVAMFRERPDDPVTLELLLRTNGAAPPIVSLLTELVAAPPSPEGGEPLVRRCRAAFAVQLLAPALKASLPALERLEVPDQPCGPGDALPLRKLWQQALADIRDATPAPIERIPRLEEGALARPMQEAEEEEFMRTRELRGEEEPEVE